MLLAGATDIVVTSYAKALLFNLCSGCSTKQSLGCLEFLHFMVFAHKALKLTLSCHIFTDILYLCTLRFDIYGLAKHKAELNQEGI